MLAAIPSLAPSWTNLNEGDLGIALVNLVAGCGDMLAYYLDRNAQEMFLPTAIARQSIQNLCVLIDYRLRRPTAATTMLTFTMPAAVGAPLVIPQYTMCRTVAGVYFTTAFDATITTGQASVSVLAYEGQVQTDVFTGTGDTLQEFQFSLPNVAQNLLAVSIDNVPWTEDGFTTSLLTPTVYTTISDINENVTLRFSLYLGSVPAQSAAISATYVTTDGAAGNIGAGLVTVLVSAITGSTGLTVTNPNPATGGEDRESNDAARTNAPRQLRRRGRVVTLQDYMDALDEENGVSKSQALNHSGYVECYVAPDNGTQFFVKAPQSVVLTHPSGSSTIPAGTHFVTVTATDAFGETTTWDYATADRSVLSNEGSVTTSTGNNLVVTIPPVAGAVTFKVYVGASGAETLEATATANPSVNTVVTLTALLGTGVTAPTVNTTGVRDDTGLQSLKLSCDAMVESERMLATVFALFNPTYVPVNITAALTVYSNFLNAQVQAAVDAAIRSTMSFDSQDFAEPVTLASLYQTVMSVAGVRSVSFTLPTADVAVTTGQIATLGTLTLTASGGS